MKIENRITKLFQQKPTGILSVFVTSGYPQLESTAPIVLDLAKYGIDLIELGIPFSDPIADGKTIQATSAIALQNGITIDRIFDAIKQIRINSEIPLILMGYYNPVFKYGFDKFLEAAKLAGADGLILPDLPPYEYREKYQLKFEELNLSAIFLVTSETTDERIRELDELTTGFLYAVSSAGTTGITASIDGNRIEYLQRLKNLKLNNPVIVGFGISNRTQIDVVNQHANGVIIGSAFLNALKPAESHGGAEILSEQIRKFVENL